MKKLIPFLALSASMIACNQVSSFDNEGKESVAMDMVEAGNASMEPPPPPPPGSGTLGFTSTATSEEDKRDEKITVSTNGASTSLPADNVVRIKVPEKIIKTADIRFRVEDYKKSRLEVEKIVKSSNAYISGENEQNNNYSISNNMVIRVLNKDFDLLVNRLCEGASEMEMKNIHTDDVTAEFVDITARLKTKKQVEERYLELLKKAGKITDILEVEEKIRVIREEIEATEGRLKLLNDQVNYSTINLNFYQAFEHSPIDKPGFFNRIGNAFGSGWQGFLSFIIGLVYAWPVWIILGVAGYALYKFIRRMLKK